MHQDVLAQKYLRGNTGLMSAAHHHQTIDDLNLDVNINVYIVCET